MLEALRSLDVESHLVMSGSAEVTAAHGRAERRAAETAPRAQIQSKRRHEEPRPRGNSLITKFGLLVIAFVALPVVVYQEFEQAYQEKQRLLLESVREQGRLMASNLRPLLLREDSTPFVELPERLPELATDEMGVRVLLSPKDETGVESFYFVASAPMMAPAALERERALLVDSGILDQLVESCTGDLALAVRHQSSDGQEEMLTSITPVTTETGCWAIIGTHVKDGFLGTSIGQPYWQTWEVRLAIVTYALLTVLVMGMIPLTIERVEELFRTEWPTSAAVFLPDGQVPKAGQIFKNPTMRPSRRAIIPSSVGRARRMAMSASRRVTLNRAGSAIKSRRISGNCSKREPACAPVSRPGLLREAGQGRAGIPHLILEPPPSSP